MYCEGDNGARRRNEMFQINLHIQRPGPLYCTLEWTMATSLRCTLESDRRRASARLLNLVLEWKMNISLICATPFYSLSLLCEVKPILIILMFWVQKCMSGRLHGPGVTHVSQTVFKPRSFSFWLQRTVFWLQTKRWSTVCDCWLVSNFSFLIG